MFKVLHKKHHGEADYGWIHSIYHFSFGDYINPKKTGIGPLRVLNIDTIMPESGYETHHHRDMEIITYVYEGERSYTDLDGKHHTLSRGSFEYISAGSGITHSEANQTSRPLKLVQLWIEPNKYHLTPHHETHAFKEKAYLNKVLHIASGKKGSGKVRIHEDVDIYALELDEEHYMPFELRGHSELYLVLLQGEAYVNGEHIIAQDAIHTSKSVHIQPVTHSHFILVEVS